MREASRWSAGVSRGASVVSSFSAAWAGSSMILASPRGAMRYRVRPTTTIVARAASMFQVEKTVSVIGRVCPPRDSVRNDPSVAAVSGPEAE